MQTQAPDTKVALTFEVSKNGTGMYLLFVDKRPPSKHDLLVTDYSGTFDSAGAAMSWYEQRYAHLGEPQALIAHFNGGQLEVRYRSIVLGEEDHVTGHPCWTYAYDMESTDENEGA